MEREEMLGILSELLGCESEEWENGYVYISIIDPIEDDKSFEYRYLLLDDGMIQINSRNNERTAKKSLRDIIWRNCGLEKVCEQYHRQYEWWENENNNISYIEVQIDDEKNGNSQDSFTMMRNLWKAPYNGVEEYHQNLKLLVGEAGAGKTSFCQGMRMLAAKEMKDSFRKGLAAFPFIFDLNEFSNGDFDKFIETELLEKYRITLRYSVFERLCQDGIFMVVLDAWDQMRGVKNILQIEQDIRQMDSLWKKQGKVLITCRRSFYQKQLKSNMISKDTVGLYKINGFDKEAAINYICKFVGNNEKERVTVWMKDSWLLNADLLEKPLNIRLIAKNYHYIIGLIDFTKEKVDTYRLLESSYNKWKEDENVKNELFVKRLVSFSLDSGLNRNVLLECLRKKYPEDNEWEKIINKLKCLDFVKYYKKRQRIEFRLAAFQEFLWAYFVLKELEEDPKELAPSESLIKRYILSKEVREWICRILEKKKERTDCLQKHLNHVKYRRKEDAGYGGSNALTLLCDLNAVQPYKIQFEEIKSNLKRTPLISVDFRGKDLSGANFFGSELEGADFSYANLTGVNFTGADLTNTKWQEHSQMNKCVFAVHKGAMCAVAGTVTGGLLFYWINDGRQEIISLQEDVINDLVYDNGKIYTVSSAGVANCINCKGEIQDALEVRRELRSIVRSKIDNCFYIGAEDYNIYRYNWKSHSQQQIKYNIGSGGEIGRISEIKYYSYGNREYLAFTMKTNHSLVLLSLVGKEKGKAIAVCQAGNYKFGKICFFDEMLVYSVIGKGVFAVKVQELLVETSHEEIIVEIPENEMLEEKQRLLYCPKADMIFFSCAEKINKLFIAVKERGEEINEIYSMGTKTEEQTPVRIELDRFYNNQVYSVVPDRMKGFCMSDDGQYAAFSGGVLAVLQNMGTFYGLVGEPVKARLSCEGVNISGCTGIDRRSKKFLTDRGAYEVSR